MKKTIILLGKTLAFLTLMCATIFLFMVAVVTIGEHPFIWLASCLGCIATFVTAVGISLGAFESAPKTAPKAQTRSEYEETINIKTA